MLLILFFLIIIIVICTLKIRINFKDIQISNINENREKTKLEHNYYIEFEIFILNIIKIAKIKFDNRKMNKAINRMKYKIEDFGIKREIKKDIKNRRQLLKAFKHLNLKLEKLNFNLEIGTDGIVSTIGIFTVISTIVPILIRNNANKVQYRISPIYNSGNVINLWVNGITEVYLVHIIYALYIINKKGRKENGRRNTRTRSSNRRAYDYSNG